MRRPPSLSAALVLAALLVAALVGGAVVVRTGGPVAAPDASSEAAPVTAPAASDGTKPVRVWTIGDSITFGYNDADHTTPGGYRAKLDTLLDADGVAVDFVGTETTNPGPGPDGASTVYRHDGWAGTRVAQLDRALQDDSPLGGGHWLDAVEADVVVVMAGTNDIGQGHDDDPSAVAAYGAGYDPDDRTQRRLFASHLVDRLEDLLATVWLHDRDVRLVVCTVPPSRFGAADPTTRTYNEAIRTRVLADARRAGVPVVLADVEAAFTGGGVSGAPVDPADLIGPDGIHPTDRGYDLVADAVAPAVVEAAGLG